MAMVKHSLCPKCGSRNIQKVPDMGGVLCNDCGYKGAAEKEQREVT